MQDVEKEIAAARAQGLDDTDDYIQELQSKWQGYAESVKEIQEDAKESAKNAVVNLEMEIYKLRVSTDNLLDEIREITMSEERNRA